MWYHVASDIKSIALRVRIYDRNVFSKRIPLGVVVVPLLEGAASCAETEDENVWYNLSSFGEMKQHATGRVKIHLSLENELPEGIREIATDSENFK